MGAASDLDDFVVPYIPHITHGSAYTPIIFTVTLVTFLGLLPVLPLIPMRALALVVGLTPFVLTHPFIRLHILPALLASVRYNKPLRARLVRTIDNDHLEDRHWNTEIKEVELWENERWSAEAGKGAGGWGKIHLKSGERSAWTRGRDGWSGVKEDGSGDVRSDQSPFIVPLLVRHWWSS